MKVNFRNGNLYPIKFNKLQGQLQSTGFTIRLEGLNSKMIFMVLSETSILVLKF